MPPIGNRLLDLLPPSQLDRLRPHLSSEILALNQTLQERGKPVEFVVFPTSGMISIVAMMRDGASVEVGLAGREGMLGVQALLGDEVSLNVYMFDQAFGSLHLGYAAAIGVALAVITIVLSIVNFRLLSQGGLSYY